MIIITKPNITPAELDHIREHVEGLGLRTSVTRGERQTIIGCIGDDDLLREAALLSLPGVESVAPVMKPYRPRSSPYAFQGLGLAALEMMAEVRAETGCPS
jgi:3-deoxy-7-phosphoheptulonate synthase